VVDGLSFHLEKQTRSDAMVELAKEDPRRTRALVLPRLPVASHKPWFSGLTQPVVLLLSMTSFLLSPPMPARGQSEIDSQLQAKLEARTGSFRGNVGIYVRHLETGATAAIQADSLFPTASMIKLPLLISLYDHVERGLLDLDTRLTYHDSLFYGGEDDGDIVNKMRPGETVTLSKLAFFMISISDNTASLWIQGLVSGVDVNRWLAEHGFQGTRVNSRVEGRREDWRAYGWGQTTPREMAELLVMVREGRAVSAKASEEMYRTLTNIYYDDEALSALPPTVQVASKQGAVSASRSEVLVVNAPSGDYVLCVITKNQEDRSWREANEGYVLLREVSKMVFEHFEKDLPVQ
jgi:beta-lactamase class A